MSAKAQVTRRGHAPALRVIEGAGASKQRDRTDVVAEVLGDGTIRLVGSEEAEDDRRFAVGQLSGDGWILWWDRRRW